MKKCTLYNSPKDEFIVSHFFPLSQSIPPLVKSCLILPEKSMSNQRVAPSSHHHQIQQPTDLINSTLIHGKSISTQILFSKFLLQRLLLEFMNLSFHFSSAIYLYLSYNILSLWYYLLKYTSYLPY